MDDTDGRSTAVTILATLSMSLLSAVITCGNLLVVIAFCKERNLQTITNTFLVSLAGADLLIGAIDLPFYIVFDMATQSKWSDGGELCNVFVTLSVVGCTASILHLCIISGDRYLAIVHPMTYPRRMTWKLCAILICLAWCLSLGLAFLFIFYEKGVPPETNQGCLVPISPLFGIVSSLVSFFIPAVIILILYAKIFVTARAHARRIQRGRMVLSGGTSQDEMRIHRGGGAAAVINSAPVASNSEYRAARTIGLVIGAFMFCWMPFFSVNFFRPWCTKTCDKIRYILFWITFVNSAMNPFIYAFTNLSFKMAFLKILCCLKNRERTPAVITISESRL